LSAESGQGESPRIAVAAASAERLVVERRTEERRRHERRWKDARFFLVERRKGNFWTYGSIALNVVLLVFIGWLFLR
jgi:hypothetical protein